MTVPRPALFNVRLLPSGQAFAAPADQPLLLAALAAGIVLPSSCRNGSCRHCICQASAGAVTYRIAWPGLSAEEKAQGWVLPCVAYPLTDLRLLQSPVHGTQR